MEQVLQVNVLWVSFVVGSVLPLLTGLVVKWRASSQVKAVVNLVLSLVAGVGTVLIQHQGSFTIQQVIVGIFAVLTASGVTYNHVWSPMGVTGAIQQATPNFGIGTVIDTSARDITQEDSSSWPAPVERPVEHPVEHPEPPAAPAAANLLSDPPREMPPGLAAAMKEADSSLLVGEPMLVFLTPVVASPENMPAAVKSK